MADEQGLPAYGLPVGQSVLSTVSRRYERGSVIITTNKAFEQWGHVFWVRRDG